MRRPIARTFAVLLAFTCASPCARLAAQTPPTVSDSARGPGADAPFASADAPEPPAEVQAEYREVVERAIAEFEAGRWAEARSLFLRAHALWPSARTLRSLGMTSFELRSYGRALGELQAALEDRRRPLSPEQRAQVTALIEQTRAFVGRFRLRLSPANATLLVDGGPRGVSADGTLLLGVGRHDLLVRADGHAELRRTLDVDGIEDEELALSLQPLAPVHAPEPAAHASAADRAAGATPRAEGGGRLWTWVAGSAALALAAASAALWFESKSEFDDLAAACRQDGCVRGQVDTSTVETLQTAHHVTLAAAIAAGAGAVTLFFVEGRGEEGEGVGVRVGVGGVRVEGRF